jgi:hypothetical protein
MATDAVNHPELPAQQPLPNSRPASNDSAAPTAIDQSIEKSPKSIESGSLKEKPSEDDEIVYPSGPKLALITFGLALATFVVSTLIPSLPTSLLLNSFIGSTR